VPVPVVDVEIKPDHVLKRIGFISHTVESTLLIQADKDTTTLDIDSVLCSEDRKVLGKVEDVIGPVSKPVYTVRLASEIQASQYPQGTPIFTVEEFSTVVLPATISSKGSDASNSFDEEPAPEVYMCGATKLNVLGT
jgi:H/ACA ribonucleoprotein complex non-core subunit NAF1